MKKINYLLFVSLLVLSLCGCKDNKVKAISDRLNVNLEGCTIITESDTHGGFLGDGEYFAKMSCSKEEAKTIKSKWKDLPLREDIEEVLEMSRCDDESCKDAYDKYDIPSIAQGYYYLLDRHSESKNGDTDLNGRSSYNFSLGIFDSENNIVYVYELDT